MSKLISVWGSKDSGRTTFALKLAREIYNKNSSLKVVCIFPDMDCPVLPYIFPDKKREDFYSLGNLLDMPDFNTNDVLSHFVLAKGIKNVVFMGYTFSENKYSYAEYSNESANTFIDMCRYLADYVIIDCSSDLADKISYYGIMKSDLVFRIASPDLKSISFLASNVPVYSDPKYNFDKHIVILNENQRDVFMPVEDAESCIGNVKYTIPFSLEVKKQFFNGELLDIVKDKKYLSVMDKIVKEAMENEQEN